MSENRKRPASSTKNNDGESSGSNEVSSPAGRGGGKRKRNVNTSRGSTRTSGNGVLGERNEDAPELDRSGGEVQKLRPVLDGVPISTVSSNRLETQASSNGHAEFRDPPSLPNRSGDEQNFGPHRSQLPSFSSNPPPPSSAGGFLDLRTTHSQPPRSHQESFSSMMPLPRDSPVLRTGHSESHIPPESSRGYQMSGGSLNYSTAAQPNQFYRPPSQGPGDFQNFRTHYNGPVMPVNPGGYSNNRFPASGEFQGYRPAQIEPAIPADYFNSLPGGPANYQNMMAVYSTPTHASPSGYSSRFPVSAEYNQNSRTFQRGPPRPQNGIPSRTVSVIHSTGNPGHSAGLPAGGNPQQNLLVHSGLPSILPTAPGRIENIRAVYAARPRNPPARPPNRMPTQGNVQNSLGPPLPNPPNAAVSWEAPRNPQKLREADVRRRRPYGPRSFNRYEAPVIAARPWRPAAGARSDPHEVGIRGVLQQMVSRNLNEREAQQTRSTTEVPKVPKAGEGAVSAPAASKGPPAAPSPFGVSLAAVRKDIGNQVPVTQGQDNVTRWLNREISSPSNQRQELEMLLENQMLRFELVFGVCLSPVRVEYIRATPGGMPLLTWLQAALIVMDNILDVNPNDYPPNIPNTPNSNGGMLSGNINGGGLRNPLYRFDTLLRAAKWVTGASNTVNLMTVGNPFYLHNLETSYFAPPEGVGKEPEGVMKVLGDTTWSGFILQILQLICPQPRDPQGIYRHLLNLFSRVVEQSTNTQSSVQHPRNLEGPPNLQPPQLLQALQYHPQPPQLQIESPQFPTKPLIVCLESPELPLEPPQLPLEPPQFPLEPPQLPLEPPQLPLEPPQLPLEPPQLPLEPPQLPMEPPQLPLEPPQLPLEPPQLTLEPPQLPLEPPQLPLEPPQLPLEPPQLPLEPPQLPLEPPQLPLEPPQLPLEPSQLPLEPPQLPLEPPQLPQGKE